MAILKVKNRDFQRSAADWMHRARKGDTIVIVSSVGPPLTLTSGSPQRDPAIDWNDHFEWLKKQPVSETNPVDDLRRVDKR